MNIWIKLISMLAKKYADSLLQYCYMAGTMLAISTSWEMNHNYVLAVVHGFFGWLYICYVVQNWLMLSLFLSALVWYILKIFKHMKTIGEIFNKLKTGLDK